MRNIKFITGLLTIIGVVLTPVFLTADGHYEGEQIGRGYKIVALPG